MARAPIRRLVLDNEAVSALLSTNAKHRKRANVIAAIAAANGRCVVPTAVRGEAHWDRTDPAAANANRLIPGDDSLDPSAANRVAQLRADVPAASVIDAAVAVTAERAGDTGGVVEILTSDVPHLAALARHAKGTIDVVRL